MSRVALVVLVLATVLFGADAFTLPRDPAHMVSVRESRRQSPRAIIAQILAARETRDARFFRHNQLRHPPQLRAAYGWFETIGESL